MNGERNNLLGRVDIAGLEALSAGYRSFCYAHDMPSELCRDILAGAGRLIDIYYDGEMSAEEKLAALEETEKKLSRLQDEALALEKKQ